MPVDTMTGPTADRHVAFDSAAAAAAAASVTANPEISQETTATAAATATATTAATATTTTTTPSVPIVELPSDSTNKALKVLFLSSDTGGGHRASAQSLAMQFELLFPGSTYNLLDLATETYLPPYNSIVPIYKHLGAHPSQWKLFYGVTNSRFMERAVDTNIKMMTVVCERAIRRLIKSYEPDVVVSVHPLQTSVPILSCAKISHETGRHLPMFTVVTDLGSAHATWFANGVEKMFVGSTQILELAKARGQVPDDKLVLLGLPIRHDFSVEAERLGVRMSPSGQAYQQTVRTKLELPAPVNRKILLVVGGGDGFGSLANIVDALYCELAKQGIDSIICVVCGRNEKLQTSLAQRDWGLVFQQGISKRLRRDQKRLKENQPRSRTSFLPTIPTMFSDLGGACGDDAVTPVGCIEAGGMTKSLRRILSSGTLMNSDYYSYNGSNQNPVFIPSPTSSRNTAQNAKPAALTIEEEKKEDIKSSATTRADVVTSENDKPGKKLQFKSLSMGALESQSEDDNLDTHHSTQSTAAKTVTKTKDAASSDTTTTTTTSGTASGEPSALTEGAAVAEQMVDAAILETTVSAESLTSSLGKVDVVGLGFITNMAEYMVAADILVSKAGPGTISEATAVSLPVMLTSFLPGQEEGNVDYVVDGEFGAYCQDTDPQAVAEEVAEWLTNDEKMIKMSAAAKRKGAPYAARDIVQQIGDSTLKWRAHNDQVAATKTSSLSSSGKPSTTVVTTTTATKIDAAPSPSSAAPSLADESTATWIRSISPEPEAFAT